MQNLKSALKRRMPAWSLAPALLVHRKLFAYQHKKQIRKLENRHLLLQTGNPGSFVLRNGVRFQITSEAREAFEHFCFRSPEMVEEMDSFLATTSGARSFFDVGAFYGVFSMAFIASRANSVVIAVEPSPKPFRVLQSIRNLNHSINMNTQNLAVGREKGTLRMALDWEHLVAVDESNVNSQETFEIPVLTADELICDAKFWPEVVKIDVEGHECDVLAGAAGLLKHSCVIHLEIHPQQLATRGQSPDTIFTVLEKFGFKAYNTRGLLLRRRAFFAPQQTFRVLFRK